MLSSQTSKDEEHEGCVVGELIRLDDDESGTNKAVEVFLAERMKDWGEELETWRWDDPIKEEESERKGSEEKREESTQTVETGVEREKVAALVKTFPNLMKEDGLLPLLKGIAKVGLGARPEGWKSGMDPANTLVVDRETLGGASPFLPVIHPCC